MYMFAPGVHRFYLPAFMVASLEDRKTADVIPDNILFHFYRRAEPSWWARVSVLSPEECDAVARFLRAIDDRFLGAAGRRSPSRSRTCKRSWLTTRWFRLAKAKRLCSRHSGGVGRHE